jgi:hypothetical protein
MNRKPALLLAALATTGAAAMSTPVAAEGPYPINPGYWEAKTTFMGLISQTDRWCVKPKDIAKFLSGPSNHIYRCTYPINQVSGGRMHFDGTCIQTKHGQVRQTIKLHGDGEYTPTTMHMTASGKMTFLGMPVSGGASAQAHFISESCPADAKAFKD